MLFQQSLIAFVLPKSCHAHRFADFPADQNFRRQRQHQHRLGKFRYAVKSPEPGESLILRCRREAAARWAASMFNRSANETSQEDVRDALGELANMVAGNVKGILAGESRLSLPVVGEWYQPEGPRSGHIVASVHLSGGEDPVHVFLLAMQPTEAVLN